VNRADLASHVVPAVVNAGPLLALLESAAERLAGNESGENDQVVGPLDALGQVVQDSAEFACGARSDDHAGAGLQVDPLAVWYRGRECDPRDAEQILRTDRGTGFVVIAFGELAVDFADLHAHWTIDEDRNFRNLFRLNVTLYVPEDRLRSADGKAWQEQMALAVDHKFHGVQKLRTDFCHWRVAGIPVGAFGDEIFHRARNGLRIAKDRR
jgi:hypothetical protein